MAEDNSLEGIGKFENVQEFTNAVQDYIENTENENEAAVNLEQFLEEIALATDQDQNEDDNNKVSLMSIHASKGLEFKNVFIVGVEEGLFPSFRSITNPKDIEEERRLFYVAITRCEQKLYITHASQRMKWGRIQTSSPSRFLNELDEQYLPQQLIYNQTTKNLKSVGKKTTSPETISKTSDDKTGLTVGMSVEHVKFGKGKIIEIEGDFPNTKATVKFVGIGQKKLLLKFARTDS